jgi:WD40 repeat protein
MQSAVTSLCFTPDSEKIITASKDGTIRVWNINGMFLIYQPPLSLIASLTNLSNIAVATIIFLCFLDVVTSHVLDYIVEVMTLINCYPVVPYQLHAISVKCSIILSSTS